MYRAYYKRIVALAKQETIAFAQRRIVFAACTGVGIAIALAFFGATHLTRDALLINLKVIVSCYVAVVVLHFIWAFISAPALLDKENQDKIDKLTTEMQLPDEALAQHLRAQLEKISSNAVRVLKFALLHDVIEAQHMSIDGLDQKDMVEGRMECVRENLLHHEHEQVDWTSPLAMAKARSFYSVPPEFRETLKRLLYNKH